MHVERAANRDARWRFAQLLAAGDGVPVAHRLVDEQLDAELLAGSGPLDWTGVVDRLVAQVGQRPIGVERAVSIEEPIATSTADGSAGSVLLAPTVATPTAA